MYHSIEKEMRELEKALEYHSKKYYEEDSPEISDYEYDAMFDHLKKLEEQYPEYASPVSMTHRVGGAVAERFEKVRHKVSLGSLTDKGAVFGRGVRYRSKDRRTFRCPYL